MNEHLPEGALVQSDQMHGRFGTVRGTRKQWHRPGLGYGEIEYQVGLESSYSWIDENAVQPATLEDVVGHYRELLKQQLAEVRTLKAALNTKRKPVKFREDKHEHLADAYRHADGSITYIVDDDSGDTDSPRTYDGNVATLIQTNNRCIDVDSDDAGLGEAEDRFTHALMRRYLAMFRPDILHFDERWSAGDSYGWGYVTRENWERWMGADYEGPVTPKEAFDAEVKVYGLWANNEVYVGIHERKGKPDDVVGGFLGYEHNEDIAMTFTDSPIVDVLA